MQRLRSVNLKKKILIIDGHPNENSFCAAIARAYAAGAKEGEIELRTLSLRNLKFELNLRQGYQKIQELEPDLIEAQNLIKWCEHLVVIYPIWWGSFPALLKGFLDRCLLPGFGFKYHSSGPFWDRLLSGRSARVIATSDAPAYYNLIVHFNAPVKIMKNMVLGFCGFKPVSTTVYGSIKTLNDAKKAKILKEVASLGRKGK